MRTKAEAIEHPYIGDRWLMPWGAIAVVADVGKARFHPERDEIACRVYLGLIRWSGSMFRRWAEGAEFLGGKP